MSKIADLDEVGIGRAAIRELPTDPGWRDSFVRTILDCLEKRHRDLGNGPAKALIVARSQPDARAFQETANRLMRERGLYPIAKLAVSDEPDAQTTLQKFRQLDRPGVLCTVDMAGEGYDCPDIVVVGFATNKLTPLYVRQVVARAQRVTDYERETLGRPIPAAVIIPDVPQLVDVMSSILEPMRHELRDPIEDNADTGEPADLQGSLLDLAIPMPKYTLDGVNGYAEGDVRVTGELEGDVGMDLVRLVEPEAQRVGLPESDAPRIIVAVRSALGARQESRPFDRLRGQEQELAVALAPADAADEPATIEPLSVERLATGLRTELGRLGNWWHVNGNTSVAIFNNEVNRAGGIGKGGRDNADVDRLRRSLQYARTQVASHCRANGLRRPAARDDLL